MWNFLQMVKPGETGFWTHYMTEALYDEHFLDQNGAPTKWTVNYSAETRQGNRACTSWIHSDELGQVQS